MHKNIKIFSISGTSMYPLYRDGDIVIGKVFDGNLKRGACYGFVYNNKRVFHRFIGKRKRNLIFSGDNTSFYESVNENEVFFSANNSGFALYNFGVTIVDIIFYKLITINPFKSYKSAFARAIYHLFKMEEFLCAKRNHM